MSGKPKKQKLPGEFALIARYFAPLAKGAKGAVGLEDDAATLGLARDQELVVTADTLIEGVHFFKNDPADLVARKTLRVNLSDLAAKGAKPIGYVLALSLSPWIDEKWIAAFVGGSAKDQKSYALPLLGGDTTATAGPLTLTITALGSAPKGKILRRGAARVGDLVFVTGTIGDGGAGLTILKGEGGPLSPNHRAFLVSRYRLPQPRVALGSGLIGLAHAALDISDGLIADLGHVAKASATRIRIEAEKVPLSPALRALWGAGTKTIIRAATSGDDYEIAFTAPPRVTAKIQALAKKEGVAITAIGRVERGRGVVVQKNGAPLPIDKPGFRHF